MANFREWANGYQAKPAQIRVMNVNTASGLHPGDEASAILRTNNLMAHQPSDFWNGNRSLHTNPAQMAKIYFYLKQSKTKWAWFLNY